MKRILALCALAVLSACGSAQDQSILSQVTTGLFTGGTEPAAAPVDPRAALTREMIEAAPNDILLVQVPTRSAVATMSPAGSNGDKVTWFAADGISLTFRQGFLIATRGFGFDMMAGDVSGLPALIRGQAAEISRSIEYLNGNDQIVSEQFRCSIVGAVSEPIEIYERTHNTIKAQEKCVGPVAFTNTYWFTPDGTIHRSSQYVSREVGYIIVDRL